MRLWKVVRGEPYMINDPRIGILSLNPKKGKKMARRSKGWSARHMAWVRSFQHKRRRSNPYSVAGPVMGLNPHRRKHRKKYKSNPGRTRKAALRARGLLGLPPVMPIIYGSLGFVGVAGLQGVVTGFLPAEWVTDPATGQPNMLAKYGVILGSLIGTTWIAKMTLGAGPAALMGIGGGIYAVSQAAHDFAPGMIPGMHGGYLPIGTYNQIRAYRQLRGLRGDSGALNIGKLGAPDFGAQNTAASAADGGQNIVQARFRRFQ